MDSLSSSPQSARATFRPVFLAKLCLFDSRKPDDLYKNGIQRSSFLPCISLIHSHFEIRDLDSPTDYRKLPRALSKVYYSPADAANRLEFAKIFESFTGDKPVNMTRTLDVWGRTLRIPRSAGKVAYFTFSELCGQPLSAADYLEVVKTFDTVFIQDIPQLTLNEKDQVRLPCLLALALMALAASRLITEFCYQARRFILFIDAAYESKTKLLTLSQEPITQIFSDKAAGEKPASADISAHQRSMMDDLGLDADTVGASSIFTGDEEVFAFARAVSRLSEMGTADWARRARSEN